MSNALKWLRTHRVAVLKGGWSRERTISLKTGAAVEQALKRLGISFQAIDVDKNILRTLQRRRVQFAYIALHGEFGEDGALQCILDFLKIPYTGSGPLASGLAMDKNLSKKLFVQHNVPTAPWVCVDKKNNDQQNRARDHILSGVCETGRPGFRHRRGLGEKCERVDQSVESVFQNIRPRAD